MKRYQVLAAAAIGVFALISGSLFFASKHVPDSQPVPQRKLSFTLHYDVKSVLELPPEIVPKESDHIRVYSRDPDGPTLAYDVETVKQTGTAVDFTIVVFNPEGIKTPDGELILGSLVGQHIDCVTHKYQPRFVVLIGEHGKVLTYMTDFKEWKTVSPGSVGTTIEKLVCKKQPESI